MFILISKFYKTFELFDRNFNHQIFDIPIFYIFYNSLYLY